MRRAPGAILRGLFLLTLAGCSTGARREPDSVAQLRDELARRRAEALALISDPKRFRPDDAAAQAEVDRLVARVRDLWLDTPALRGADDWNVRAERHNQSCADPGIGMDERAHARIMNDYREMMGRRRLFLDGRLCRAAKKHSVACNRESKLWHTGPDGDPATRATAEGFPDPVSEHVCIGHGSPGDVWWEGWYRSPDQHRSALSQSWSVIGYGYDGRVGTQLFSGATPTPR